MDGWRPPKEGPVTMPTLPASFPSILPGDARSSSSASDSQSAGALDQSLSASTETRDFAAVLEKPRPTAKAQRGEANDRIQKRDATAADTRAAVDEPTEEASDEASVLDDTTTDGTAPAVQANELIAAPAPVVPPLAPPLPTGFTTELHSVLTPGGTPAEIPTEGENAGVSSELGGSILTTAARPGALTVQQAGLVYTQAAVSRDVAAEATEPDGQGRIFAKDSGSAGASVAATGSSASVDLTVADPVAEPTATTTTGVTVDAPRLVTRGAIGVSPQAVAVTQPGVPGIAEAGVVVASIRGATSQSTASVTPTTGLSAVASPTVAGSQDERVAVTVGAAANAENVEAAATVEAVTDALPEMTPLVIDSRALSVRTRVHTTAGKADASASANLAGVQREGSAQSATTLVENAKNVSESIVEEGGKDVSAEVGTFAAKPSVNMPAIASTSAETTPLVEGVARALDVGSGSLTASKTDAATATLETSAAETVGKIVELTEAAAAASKTSVEVSVPFGDEHIRVRIRFNEGQVQTTISSRSADVRDALSREWQAVQPSLDAARVAFATPVFKVESSAATANANDASYDSGAGARQQSQQETPGQSRSTYVSWPTGSSTRSASASPASAPTSAATSSDSNRRLQVFA